MTQNRSAEHAAHATRTVFQDAAHATTHDGGNGGHEAGDHPSGHGVDPGGAGGGAGGGPAAADQRECERIELEEAVCDSFLGMLQARATGAGNLGAVLYRSLPSRQLVSGFLLPKYDAAGDDVTNDIKVAVHGMDFRMRLGEKRTVIVEPAASVYVRLLPSADDLFDPEMAHRWSLLPRSRFKPEEEREIRERIKERMTETRPTRETNAEYKQRRARITAEVFAQKGVVLRGDAADAVEMGDHAGPDDQRPRRADHAADRRTQAQDTGQDALEEVPHADAANSVGTGHEDGDDDENGRGHGMAVVGGGHVIPDELAVREPIPQKWLRLPLDLPPFEFDPSDPTWRTGLAAYNVILAAAPLNAVRAFLATQEGHNWAYRKVRVLPSRYQTRAAWERFLEEIRQTAPDPMALSNGVVPTLAIDIDHDPLDPGHLTVRVALENRSAEPSKKERAEVEAGIFDVRVRTTLPQGALARLPMDRVKPSYHLAGWLERYAIGVNGGADHERLSDGDPLWLRVGNGDRLTSTWMPRWVQPRIEPTDVPGVSTHYADLERPGPNTAKPGPAVDGGGLDGLSLLPEAMRTWVRALTVDPERDIDDPDDRRRERENFDADVRIWLEEADAIELGIDVLRRSRTAWQADAACEQAIPYRAWLATNRTFRRAGRRKRITGWRLFQLAFVLTLIPALASRLRAFEYAYRDCHETRAALLYFPTGGGKSEAFFGIKVFALFFDRMRGKERGITAMIRYPLRLLTLQQAQRLAKTLAAAELVRRELRLPGRPFEIGFYVGSANTPNSTTVGAGRPVEELADIPLITDPDHRDEDALAARLPMYRERSLAYNKIPSCPFCQARTVLRLFPDEEYRLGIVCTNEDHGVGGCPWNQAERGQSPLPFLLVDTDIYRRGPSVLIGTVDKLAMIGQHRSTIQKIAGMFGLGRWFNDATSLVHVPDRRDDLAEGPPPGSVPLKPAYAGGENRFFDPVPLLLTQDEGHLLEESLGTFAGLFETTLETWFGAIADMLGDQASRVPQSTRGRRPKVIVATATVSNPDRQVRAIYEKFCTRFPHQGPSLYESFYARPKRFPDPAVHDTRRALMQKPSDEEFVSPWMRVYASLMTNGRPHTTTTVTVLAMHHLHLTQVLTDLDDPVTRLDVVAHLKEHLSPGPLRARHEAALDRIVAAGDWGTLRGVVDLFRITLTYVTNRKGGDQVLSALGGIANDLHRQQGRRLDDLRVELISGGVDAQRIQDIIRMAEEVMPASTPLSEVLRGVVATSAISHGVDVDNFNAMFFAGLPSDIAEYIQASSRVGRLHVGFSLLIPTPQARRDRYVVEIHETFHRFLERMIAPPAVERWADRAVERAIPSLFQNWLIGIVAQREFITKPDGAKHDANLMSSIGAISRYVQRHGEVRFLQEAVDHIVEAVGVNAPAWGATDQEHYRALISKNVKIITDTILDGHHDGAALPTFWEDAPLPHRPMTSLRDVDQGGFIVPSNTTPHHARTNPEKVKTMMRLIRNGTLGRAAADSELDDD